MTVEFRNARPADAEALSRLGAETFEETFGHLYKPDDLQLFLKNHEVERWQAELADPEFAVLLVEADG